jgi:hypothetical protein
MKTKFNVQDIKILEEEIKDGKLFHFKKLKSLDDYYVSLT